MSNCFSQELELTSSYLNEKRVVNIRLPDGYECSKATYPVIIVFDGELLSDYVTSLFKYNYDVYPPSIIVGVHQIKRDEELVSIEGKEDKNVNFSNFVNEELLSYIEKNYRTNVMYTLIGHSFGGVFTLNTLFKNKKIKYGIAISPTIWGIHKKSVWSEIEKQKQVNKQLFLGYGENENKGLKKGVKELSTFLEKDAGVKLKMKQFLEEDHNSSILIGIRKGLGFLYQNWEANLPENLWTKIEEEKKPDYFYDYFDTLSKKNGKQLIPSEEDYNTLGYYFLEEKQYSKAISVFEKNTLLYPCSSNVYDSLAEAYLTEGDKKKALKYYKKALKTEQKNDKSPYLIEGFQKQISSLKKELK
ncbi:alpha/beta hydrolase [Tenacibaculum sp. 190524A02b]|uniref:alpha/beta hydrolase n=1 Tax=Tenacibaculum vairaonense TaxID=3137860 RepID=UPI0032B14CBB